MSSGQEAPKKGPDKEFAAMKKILGIFDDLDDDTAVFRVFRYVENRLESAMTKKHDRRLTEGLPL